MLVVRGVRGLAKKRFRGSVFGWELEGGNPAYPPSRVGQEDQLIRRIA